jgi:hypothetical protein
MKLPRLGPLRVPGFGFRKSQPKPTVRKGNSQPAKTSAQAARNPFHAVSVAGGWECCSAVSELEGCRFLPQDAPKLPLPGCDQARCRCGYEHHADRRAGPRREAEFGIPGVGFRPIEERRVGSSRRANDKPRAREEAVDYFNYGAGTQKILHPNQGK